MIKTNIRRIIFTLLVLMNLFSQAQSPQAKNADQKEWIVRSNKFTQSLIDIDEKYSPEFGSEQGLAFYYTLILVSTF